MDHRSQFLDDLIELHQRYSDVPELNDALAVISALGAFTSVEAESTLAEAVTPCVIALMTAYKLTKSDLN